VSFRLLEASYEGVCLIRPEGRFAIRSDAGGAAATIGFHNLFDRRVNENNRYFVIDLSKVEYFDSTSLGEIVRAYTRLSLRVSKCCFATPLASRANALLGVTKLNTLPGFHATLDEALSDVLDKAANSVEAPLRWEERLSVDSDGKISDMGGLLGRLRKICIFLASSEELRDDRDEFEIYFRQLNDELLDRGCYLVINRWENFLDAMTQSRLQDEYNKAVKDCDIFVSLFSTKTGKFTEEEFDTAHQQFKDTGKPLIYTFFKDTAVNVNTIQESDLLSLLKFKQRLKDLGHFYTPFSSSEDLKLRFRDQLAKLLDGPLRK
jgi:hypothetical protein